MVLPRSIAQRRPVGGRRTTAPAVQLLVVAGHAPADIVATRPSAKRCGIYEPFHHQRSRPADYPDRNRSYSEVTSLIRGLSDEKSHRSPARYVLIMLRP